MSMGGLSVQWNTVRVDSADEIQWKNSVEMLWVGDFPRKWMFHLYATNAYIIT